MTLHSTETVSNSTTSAIVTLKTVPRRSPEERKTLKQHIPELLWFERLIRKYQVDGDLRVEHKLKCEEHELPMYSYTIGNRTDPNVPCVLLTGGVHGVERIGVQVILAWMQSLFERLIWDKSLQDKLSTVKLVFVPMVNPVGIYRNNRCNGNGIDLNRNAPVTAEDSVPFLAGGHRLTRFLPWYRGREKEGLEPENIALERVIHREVFPKKRAICLDVHSGFGMRDRLWFPYAFRKKPIGCIDQYLALKILWERAYPNHNYEFEPQSHHYLTHGDIWDYFYLQSQKKDLDVFLPLTLELGSWAWVKKRPQQLFNFAGLFNPQKHHRHERVLRRHIVLLEFLLSAAINADEWLPDQQHSLSLVQAAKSMWFK